jgi:hypothetical protein
MVCHELIGSHATPETVIDELGSNPDHLEHRTGVEFS